MLKACLFCFWFLLLVYGYQWLYDMMKKKNEWRQNVSWMEDVLGLMFFSQKSWLISNYKIYFGLFKI